MDGTFKLHRHDLVWDWKTPLNIYFFGDVHRDTDACDVDRYGQFLAEVKADKDALVFGLGDYFDFASSREQKALSKADLHETTVEHFDMIVQKKNRDFVQEASFMRGRLVGLIGGNHSWKLLNGKYADEDLAERFNCAYLGWLGIVALTIKFKETDQACTLYFTLCHGKGGGKLRGTSINKVDDLMALFPMTDVAVMGHDHQRWAMPVPQLTFSNHNKVFKVKQKDKFLVRSGSFMKSYVDGKSQYTTKGLMKPASLGGVKLQISFKNNSNTLSYSIKAII